MPNIKSAKKRVLITKDRNAANRAQITVVKNAIKKINNAIDTNNIEEAERLLPETMSVLDSAVSKGLMHKNTAANKKSGIAKRIADIKAGNALPLGEIPVGTLVHNVELQPGNGGVLVRTAGAAAQLMAKEGKYATLKMPSGEMRMILLTCKATIGQVGNLDHELVSLGKAGRKRHMGVKPTVRGVVMNPNDHPHGGGEGKSPVGMPSPVTPWGKPALGYKTRKHRKASDRFIVKRIN